jgi:hypothetical protein
MVIDRVFSDDNGAQLECPDPARSGTRSLPDLRDNLVHVGLLLPVSVGSIITVSGIVFLNESGKGGSTEFSGHQSVDGAAKIASS